MRHATLDPASNGLDHGHTVVADALGKLHWIHPRARLISVKFTPIAVERIRTSPGFGSGISISRTSRTSEPPKRSNRIAFTLFVL
jgi:hypothetical protein